MMLHLHTAGGTVEWRAAPLQVNWTLHAAQRAMQRKAAARCAQLFTETL
jgi:hypothetical protein